MVQICVTGKQKFLNNSGHQNLPLEFFEITKMQFEITKMQFTAGIFEITKMQNFIGHKSQLKLF